MKNKLKNKLTILVLLASIFVIGSGFSDNNDEISIKKVNLQVLSTKDLDTTTISMYTSNGWTYNREAQQLEREVTYKDEKIVINGKTYETDNKGEVDVRIGDIKSDKVSISTETLTDKGHENSQVIDKKDLNSDKQVVVQEVIDVDGVIDSMDKGIAFTRVGGLYNGQLPRRGQYVHCNRFNGNLGNGRYYSKTGNPVMASRNFINSDCYWSLTVSNTCMRDYTSNPYCSTRNTSTAGKCSPNIIGHSRLYHKHTSIWGPTS